ncbi:HlyD family efflux transporter periplasmic adaptor subunit [Aureliella helgolandensis]|uniref:HlyD family efflux transporter periplasmic adaptor subunit n=1 Tax=Aureliella helgolandensis TaxID=2527968 RepID=UPI0018D0D52F|nr:HlyD family efflux transporter periplasmic adaptor subunit [Aureliella helgolandensis]
MGCNPNPSTSKTQATSNALSSDLPVSKVNAQGQILPAGGFIQLMGTPGDVVDEMLVEVGQRVTAGTPLVRTRSEQVQAAQLEALVQKRLAAQRQQENAMRASQRQLRAAELQLERIDAQADQLAKKEDLLQLAEQQVAATQKILTQLQAIANDSVTREFVGQIEIERQQVAVGEAELAYQQQVQNHQQAVDELEWARRSAAADKLAAADLLQATESSDTLKVIELELRTLKQQIAATRIVAPSDGIILSVGASKGEASGHRPLVEMADDSQLVCEVEVNEMDAVWVEPGQTATISSRAFLDGPLLGFVQQKFQLVGQPQLRPLDPLARTDYRAVTVVINLSPSSAARAQQWLQLQVEVEIQIDSTVSSK